MDTSRLPSGVLGMQSWKENLKLKSVVQSEAKDPSAAQIFCAVPEALRPFNL
jgi:hypothetical protein